MAAFFWDLTNTVQTAEHGYVASTLHCVELREFYNGYAPPLYVHSAVRALLDSVPDHHLKGLDCVVLTNQSGHPRRYRLGKVTSRKHRYPQSQVVGRYHRGQRGHRPWIEIFVDNMAPDLKLVAWVPLLREYLLARVLFHEIGHHIHLTMVPEHCDKEDAADAWKEKLLRNFLRARHWYVKPLRMPILLIGKACGGSLNLIVNADYVLGCRSCAVSGDSSVASRRPSNSGNNCRSFFRPAARLD